MEHLQIAQVLADLSDLQNTDPAAATALLSANKTLSQTYLRRKSQASSLPDAPKFDKLGRRIVRSTGSGTGTSTGASTPDRSRMKSGSDMSGYSVTGQDTSSANASGAATPNSGNNINAADVKSSNEGDIDMTRARTLLELFEKRANFKQMGDTGLMRSKERVDAVVASYARKDLEMKERTARARYLSPRA